MVTLPAVFAYIIDFLSAFHDQQDISFIMVISFILPMQWIYIKKNICQSSEGADRFCQILIIKKPEIAQIRP